MDASTLNSGTCILKACYPHVFVCKETLVNACVRDKCGRNSKSVNDCHLNLECQLIKLCHNDTQFSPAGHASDASNPILLCQIVHSLKKEKYTCNERWLQGLAGHSLWHTQAKSRESVTMKP
jgi:hypothetical protein